MNAYMRGKTATQTKSARLATIARTHTSGLCALGLALVPAYASAQQTAGQSARGALESGDIIVTAQKREERLRDVPVPVTAVSASTLIDQNQTRAQDFFSNVPGVNVQFQNNRAQLAIRGITTSPASGNPVVGFTIDDVPYGSSIGQGGLFGAAPDLDPAELERIEVLRGPQGTLYGASSIGGLVKYITKSPNTDGISGSIGAGANTVYSGGHELGYNIHGAINVPLGDTFAVRASALTRKDPGYINNVLTGKKNVNSSRVTSGRLSALWKPSETFSVKLGALYQNTDVFRRNTADTRLGSPYLQNDQFGTGRGNYKIQFYDATLTADLGGMTLTSVSGYSASDNFHYADFTASPITPFVYNLAFPAYTDFGNVFYNTHTSKKLSQELRLSGSVGQAIEWIAGGFYTHEQNNYRSIGTATDPTNGNIYGVVGRWRNNLTFEEYAAFGNITARVSEQFDVQFGARYSENRQNMNQVSRIQLDLATFGIAPDRYVSGKAKGHSFTYQVTPRFKPSPDHMIYGRLATGYRPGGPNPNCDNGTEFVPCQFRPDKVVNYELGAKGDLVGPALSYDVSIYSIDWKDLQQTQVSSSGTFTFNSNVGKARSRGVEFALESRPTSGLTLALWGAYNDAQLRDSFPVTAVYAAAGDRLPFSSRYSGRFSASYEAPITDDVTGLIGAAATYVGNREGEFVPTQAEAALREKYPSYVQVNLNASVMTEGWKLNVYVQNLTNKAGVTGGGYNNQTNFNRYWLNYTQPRTVGLSIEKTF